MGDTCQPGQVPFFLRPVTHNIGEQEAEDADGMPSETGSSRPGDSVRARH